MNQTTDMTVGSPLKHLILFSLPLMLTNLGQQFYMIVDAAVVGRGVGVNALASVGASDWLYWLVLWSVMGATQGFSVFISQSFGEKDFARMNKIIAMSSILCVIIGLILTFSGILLALPMLSLLKTPADIMDGAKIYLITMIGGTLIVTAYNMAAAILRAFGNGKDPLIAMIIAGILNIIFDLIFVLCFHWGIFGAALASVLAQLFSFIYCVVRIKKISFIAMPVNVWKPDCKMMKELLKFSLPITLQYMIIAASGIILQSSINAQGSTFVAGFTATNKLYGLLECTAISLGLAFTTFTAQNYGAGNIKRVRSGVKTGLMLSLVLSFLISVFFIASGKYMLELFLDPSAVNGEEALNIGRHYLFVMSLLLFILFPLHIYRNALPALGVSIWAMISGVAESIIRAFMGTLIVYSFGTFILYYVEPCAWIGALLLSLIPYYFYQRKLLSVK